MSNSDPREVLYEALKEMHYHRDDISIADLDFIETLAETCGDNVPRKIFQLIDEFSENGGNFDFAIERIFNIMRATMLFPDAKSGSPEEAILPTFSLDEDDTARVMKLCADMRDIVFSSSIFDAPHKRRLPNRIVAIEYQINQEKGLFDVILAGFNDFGEAGGKFGTDIKPLTDRIREIAGIVRPKTKEYEQLPAPEEIKKLPAPDEDSKD